MIFDPAFIPIFKQSIKPDLESLNKTGPVCHSGHKKHFFLNQDFILQWNFVIRLLLTQQSLE